MLINVNNTHPSHTTHIMNFIRLSSVAIAATACSIGAGAETTAETDTVMIPERVISLGSQHPDANDLIAILYNRQDLHYSDPSSPRFIFIDRKGSVLFGIGGYVKGTVQYDFDGAIDDGANFTTYDIPVPANPSLRNQFYSNANQSTFFVQLLGRTERFGTYEMFIQTNFSGGGVKGYDLKLKQAYLRLGYVTAGLTSSVFVDGAAGTPTIDDEGPAGEMSGKNILLKYAPRLTKNLSVAVSIENPSAGYRLSNTTEAINQRFPDIPAYIQYGWDDGDSHIRLSGLLRNLSYRDITAGRNRFATGWAAQLSGVIKACDRLNIFYQGAYGHGYAHYINDLGDANVDLIPDPENESRLHAPAMCNFEGGVQINLASNAFIAASYSQAHLYQATSLGPDTYKRGQYVSLSGFYEIIPDLTIGLEYLHGARTNVDHASNHANRVEGMLKFSF